MTADPRPGGGDEAPGRGGAGAVVRDLEDVHGWAAGQAGARRGLAGAGGVAGEHHAPAAGLQEEHDAVRVGVAAHAGRREHRGLGLAETRREAAAHLHRQGAGAAERRRQTALDGAGDPRAPRPVLPDERGQPARVVGVLVRDRRGCRGGAPRAWRAPPSRRPRSLTGRRRRARSTRRCAAPPRRPGRRGRRRRAAPALAKRWGSAAASPRSPTRPRTARRHRRRRAAAGRPARAVLPARRRSSRRSRRTRSPRRREARRPAAPA